VRTSTNELWERFAREDAEPFILTDPQAHHEESDRFFRLGELDAARILQQVEPWLRRFDVAVEIGCGVGRLAIPTASRFRRVFAIDVSPTMLAKCAANCEARGVENVETVDAGATREGAFVADLVFSHLVLQHIEDFAQIERYLEFTRSWLREDGVSSLQFDTRPSSLPYRLHACMPDALLPRHRRRGIRRVRRPRDDVLVALRRAGLTLVHEEAPGTERHVVVAARADAATL
jgi:SAM-dependent methyltransferase